MWGGIKCVDLPHEDLHDDAWVCYLIIFHNLSLVNCRGSSHINEAWFDSDPSTDFVLKLHTLMILRLSKSPKTTLEDVVGEPSEVMVMEPLIITPVDTLGCNVSSHGDWDRTVGAG